ncbi:cGMP-dependent 3',5'-cyclic phosphodiesterase-like isoform X1 [Lingula anatina]|uniref:cGMP-dependent 3',5'-cyclic phosphodiesterase-like isoform X1 n=1 Tax=Lingula anatina TaxID=7574 RepID=A0A1S3JMY1_LINAN|nr:cGMP-dependent 3',5'-cyclic phosphodiesterase-like isoform X1 [Lingula anatina]|eukprot:XP_013411516.1 cGMP-dependent 3',5'-cyclic phosphodiesterase-like isoform X1 [Lingula anatina]
MVIVTFHLVTAGFIYWRDAARFVKCMKTREKPRVETASLQLSRVLDLEQFRTTIKDAVALVLPNVKCVTAFVQDPYHTDDSHKSVPLWLNGEISQALPKEGILWQAYDSKQRVIKSHLDQSDPARQLLDSGQFINSGGIVVCSPVLEDEQPVVVLLIVCDSVTESHLSQLEVVQNQIAACHYRLKQSPYRATDMPRPMYKENSQEKSSEAILQLCAELYDQDAASLQVKVIKYVSMNH